MFQRKRAFSFGTIQIGLFSLFDVHVAEQNVASVVVPVGNIVVRCIKCPGYVPILLSGDNRHRIVSNRYHIGWHDHVVFR